MDEFYVNLVQIETLFSVTKGCQAREAEYEYCEVDRDRDHHDYSHVYYRWRDMGHLS